MKNSEIINAVSKKESASAAYHPVAGKGKEEEEKEEGEGNIIHDTHKVR